MKRPSFQFYPKDLLSDTEAMAMPNEALGMYFKLLAYDWINDGIPSDDKTIMRIAGFEWTDFQGNMREAEDHDIILSHLHGKLIAHPSKVGFFTNPRLQKERAKQDDFVQKKSEAGREGAKKRWGKPKKTSMAKNSTPIVLPIANDSSSSSSSSSSIVVDGQQQKSFAHPIVENLWKTLDGECEKLGLENAVNTKLFEVIYEEFDGKVTGMGAEIKSCLFHHKSKGKQKIVAPAIRNWFKNFVKFAKMAELKNMTKAKDRVHTSESIKN